MRKPAILFLPVLAFLHVSFAAAEERRSPYNHPPRSVRSRDVDQQHLRLELSIDLDKEAFRGRAIHTMSPLKPVRVIHLDAADMKIDKVTLGDGANFEGKRCFRCRTKVKPPVLERPGGSPLHRMGQL